MKDAISCFHWENVDLSQTTLVTSDVNALHGTPVYMCVIGDCLHHDTIIIDCFMEPFNPHNGAHERTVSYF